MDMTSTIEAKSDQWNADDLMGGPITVTIESVSPGKDQQPVDVHLVESPKRAYRPSKSMRRVMVLAWGRDSSVYAGRRLTLYRDPTVPWGGVPVGGIKISHMSHIESQRTFPITEKRGVKTGHTVEPLPDAPVARFKPSPAQVAASTDLAELTGWRDESNPRLCAAIDKRVAELSAPDDHAADIAAINAENERQAGE